MEEEVAWQADYSANVEEWRHLQMQTGPPQPIGRLQRFCQLPTSVNAFDVDTGNVQFQCF